ncbi:MAG: hypothetical protein E7282_02150 [Lachnospiraceae bacterium]|nr:hypothetical protein [Lachnospiraceae bacterium]
MFSFKSERPGNYMSEKRVAISGGIAVLGAIFLNIACKTSHIMITYKSIFAIVQNLLISLAILTLGYRLNHVLVQKGVRDYYKQFLVEKYFKIVCWLSIIIAFTIAVCFAVGQQARIDGIWGTEMKNRMLGPLFNVLGIADIVGYRWIVAPWKYVRICMLYMIVAPILHYVIKKIRPAWGFAIGFLMWVFLCYKIPEHAMICMFPVFFIGMIANQHLNQGKARPSAVIFHNVSIYAVSAWLIHVPLYFWWMKKILQRLHNGFLISVVATVIITVFAIAFSELIIWLYQHYAIILKNKKSIDLLFSLLLVGANYLYVFYNSVPAFLTNDDSRIQHVLSGSFLGEPYFFHQYIHPAISIPIAWLFSCISNVPWWYLFCHLLVFIGLMAIHYTVIRLARERELPLLFIIAIVELFDGSFIMFNLWRMSFTLTSILIGCASIILIFVLTSREKLFWEKRGLLVVGSILCFILACFVRISEGYVLVAYVVLISAYGIFSRQEALIRRVGKLAFVIAIAVCMVKGIGYVQSDIIKNINGNEFIEFNHARSTFIDYPHDTYEENPELYQSVGWDEDTLFLAESWCFMNDNITTEALQMIAENQTISIKENIKDAFEQIKKTPPTVVALIAYGLSCVLILICLFPKRQKWLTIAGICNLFGTLILLVYLAIKGRFIYRAIAVVLIPATLVNMLLYISNIEHKARKKHLMYVLTALISVCLVIPICSSVFQSKEKEQNMLKKFKIQSDTYAYFNEHPENIYITEVYSLVELNPFDLSDESNMMYYGSALFHSDIMDKKAEKLGIADMNGNVFKQSNVYYVSRVNIEDESKFESRNTLSAFYNTLKKDYGAIGIQKIDGIDQTLWVYRFVYEDSKQLPIEYYDIVDGIPLIVDN